MHYNIIMYIIGMWLSLKPRFSQWFPNRWPLCCACVVGNLAKLPGSSWLFVTELIQCVIFLKFYYGELIDVKKFLFFLLEKLI
jgi:hypothetical protein